MSLTIEAVEFYREKKGQVPTERCIEDGLSCSQRFEQAYNLAIEEGLEAPQALLKALKVTADACSRINNTSQIKAYETLFIGTAMVLTGLSANPCATDICGDTETRESYGCTRNICDICPPKS